MLKHMTRYYILDTKIQEYLTGPKDLAKLYLSRAIANRVADKLNLEYGAHRYSVEVKFGE
jgi:hypothetical protein